MAWPVKFRARTRFCPTGAQQWALDLVYEYVALYQYPLPTFVLKCIMLYIMALIAPWGGRILLGIVRRLYGSLVRSLGTGPRRLKLFAKRLRRYNQP